MTCGAKVEDTVNVTIKELAEGWMAVCSKCGSEIAGGQCGCGHTGYPDYQERHSQLAKRAATEPLKAHEILEQSAFEMRDRGKTYDKPEGERSMGATVAAFKAITGITMTEQQGWQFMEILKLVRSNQGGYRADSFIDGAAYAALAGEAAARNKSDVIANG